MITFLFCLALQQDPVDQNKIDKAIDDGARYLLRRLKAGTLNSKPKNGNNNSGRGPSEEDLLKDELVLYTLIVAGVDDNNEDFQKLLKSVLDGKLEATYRVALQAMALETLDASKYQGRIAQCGQFLLDNQCANGQWSYGKEVKLDTWTMGDSKGGAGTKARSKIPIKKRGSGPGTGDNSNTQYAILGLRACMLADVGIPLETFILAHKWWMSTQNRDGGWDYHNGSTRTEHSYGTMTAGGASSVAICDCYMKRDWKKDAAIKNAIGWLATNFSVTTHPRFDWKDPAHGWFHYWLYALERAGILGEYEKIGAHKWYQEGARYLVDAQGKDGAWDKDRDKITNTCFAILFLRKATKPLKPVATEDNSSKKP